MKSFSQWILPLFFLSSLVVNTLSLSPSGSINTINNVVSSESAVRPTLTLPQLSFTLPPMLGVNREFRASTTTTTTTTNIEFMNESNFDSVIAFSTSQKEEAIQKRTEFDSNAEVHILRSSSNIWGNWSPQKAIKAAEQHNLWSTGRHHLYPTTDIPAMELPNGMGDAALELATQVILPSIAFAFDTPLGRLSFKDMFLAKYEPSGQPGLGKHTDDSAYSFNMLLSDPILDFEGGGTWIQPVGLVRPNIGDVLMHRGNLLHEGCPVSKGKRYVLVGFVQSDDVYDNTSNSGTTKTKEKSELLIKTIQNFPLGMVIEVDEGDKTRCAMIANVMKDGLAMEAGIQRGDCIRGVLLSKEQSNPNTMYNFLEFDEKNFDQVMEILISRKNCGPVQIVLERWCSE